MVLLTSRGTIDDAFEMADAFPRPCWDRIAAWVDAHGGGADLWDEVARGWLLRLCEHMGAGYATAESPGFLLLAPREATPLERLLGLLERTRSWLTALELDPRSGDDLRKVVCLVLAGNETYLDFIAHYYPIEGEFGHSAGVFLREGYPHFVARNATGIEGTLVHELTHACMADQRLPLWVEEGLTQLVEQEVTGWPALFAQPRKLLWLRTYWRRQGLHAFWYGAGFHRADRGQAASYDLALLLAQKLLERDRNGFRRFVLTARREDCGSSALRDACGLELSSLAASFLGEGDWEPKARSGAELASRGYFFIEYGRLKEAALDLRAAVSAGHEDAATLNTLAWILATSPDGALRDGAEAVRHATRACELTGWSWEPALDTLGATYAEVGDFARAIEFAKKAVALAPPTERAENEARLELYRAGKPYREAPPELPP